MGNKGTRHVEHCDACGERFAHANHKVARQKLKDHDCRPTPVEQLPTAAPGRQRGTGSVRSVTSGGLPGLGKRR